MSDIQGDYRKIANKFGHYSDHRGMLAGMVIELADRIEALEAELKQAQELLRTARDFAVAYKEKADKAKATIEAVRVFPTEIGLTWSGAEVQAWLSKRLANAGEQERKNEDE